MSPGSHEPVGCRLFPKLVDLRPPAQAKSERVKGVLLVDVTMERSADLFLDWARRREKEVGSNGLRPAHVLMTGDGTFMAAQQRFLQAILERGVAGICIL